jgi:hypothetical protein
MCFDYSYSFCVKHLPFLEEFSEVLLYIYTGLQVQYL